MRRAQDVLGSGLPEEFADGVFGLGHAVGVQDERVAACHGNFVHAISRLFVLPWHDALGHGQKIERTSPKRNERGVVAAEDVLQKAGANW